MPLPTLEKTWSFDVNKPISDWAGLFFQIKDGLVNCGWTVSSSCGKGGTGGLIVDTNDNWLSAADIEFDVYGSPHSWIVLRSPGGLEFCMENASTNMYWQTFRCSPDGLYATTGLSSGTRPPADDEIYVSGNPGGGGAGYVHVMATADGCMRSIVCRGGYSTGLLLITAVKEPNPSTWTKKLFACAGGGTTSYTPAERLEYSDGWVNGTFLTRFRVTTDDEELAHQSAVMTYEMVDGSPIMYKNVTGQNVHGFTPVGLFKPDFPNKAWRGRLVDFWWGQTVVNGGDTYPSGGGKEFVQFGDMIFPWDGTSTPLLT